MLDRARSSSVSKEKKDQAIRPTKLRVNLPLFLVKIVYNIDNVIIIVHCTQTAIIVWIDVV